MIRIQVIGDPASLPSYPYPLDVSVAFSCDSGKHGLFPPEAHVLTSPDGFIGAYSTAMRLGWKDTFRKGERIFLCPECSGKSPAMSGT